MATCGRRSGYTTRDYMSGVTALARPSSLTHSLTHTPPQETRLIITTFGLFLSVRRA
jgi:hypothetical protein